MSIFIENKLHKEQDSPTHPHSIKSWFRSHGWLLFGCLIFSTLAVAQYRDTILLLGYEAREFDFGGGSGGRRILDARCDRGFVAVGFHVRTGEFFNEVWLDCAPMRSDGSLGEERRATPRAGSPGGRDIHDALCPPGRALLGLTGRTGASIDSASGMCGPIRGHEERRHDEDRRRDDRRDDNRRDNDRRENDRRENDRRDDDRRRDRMELTAPVTIPRPGGRPAETACPPDSVLVGFRTRSGEWIDHLSILCSEVQRRY